jgi:hypothetical protein
MKEVGELLGAGELRLSQIHSRAVKHLRAAKAGGAPYRPLPRSIRALFSDNLWCPRVVKVVAWPIGVCDHTLLQPREPTTWTAITKLSAHDFSSPSLHYWLAGWAVLPACTRRLPSPRPSSAPMRC